MLSKEVVKKTLSNTTHYYFNVDTDNSKDTSRYNKYCFPGLMYPRQQETLASDTLFPTIK